MTHRSEMFAKGFFGTTTAALLYQNLNLKTFLTFSAGVSVGIWLASSRHAAFSEAARRIWALREKRAQRKEERRKRGSSHGRFLHATEEGSEIACPHCGEKIPSSRTRRSNEEADMASKKEELTQQLSRRRLYTELPQHRGRDPANAVNMASAENTDLDHDEQHQHTNQAVDFSTTGAPKTGKSNNRYNNNNNNNSGGGGNEEPHLDASAAGTTLSPASSTATGRARHFGNLLGQRSSSSKTPQCFDMDQMKVMLMSVLQGPQSRRRAMEAARSSASAASATSSSQLRQSSQQQQQQQQQQQEGMSDSTSFAPVATGASSLGGTSPTSRPILQRKETLEEVIGRYSNMKRQVTHENMGSAKSWNADSKGKLLEEIVLEEDALPGPVVNSKYWQAWMKGDQSCVNDSADVAWLDHYIGCQWPRIATWLEGLMRNTVEPAINNALPSLLKGSAHFEEVSFQGNSPRFGPLSVYSDMEANEIELRLGVQLHSNIKAWLNVKGLSLGISNLKLKGILSIVFKPAKAAPPFFGGMQIYFLNPPKLEMEFHGAGRLVEMKSLKPIVYSAISNALANQIVLPNRYARDMDFTDNTDLADLRNPDPTFVLRLTVVRGEHLKACDSNLFKENSSDPYVVVFLGTTRHTSSVVDQSLNPEWNFTKDFPVYDPNQLVNFKVYDKDQYSADDLIGEALDVPLMDLLEGGSEDLKEIQLKDHEGHEGCGTIFVQTSVFCFMSTEEAKANPGDIDGAFVALKAIRIRTLLDEKIEMPVKVQLAMEGADGVTRGSHGPDEINLSDDMKETIGVMLDEGRSQESILRAMNWDKAELKSEYELAIQQLRAARHPSNVQLQEELEQMRQARARMQPTFTEVVQVLIPEWTQIWAGAATAQIRLQDKKGHVLDTIDVTSSRILRAPNHELISHESLRFKNLQGKPAFTGSLRFKFYRKLDIRGCFSVASLKENAPARLAALIRDLTDEPAKFPAWVVEWMRSQRSEFKDDTTLFHDAEDENGEQLVRSLADQKEPSNVAMDRGYDAGKLKEELGYSQSCYGSSCEASSSSRPPNMAVYCRTPVRLSAVSGTGSEEKSHGERSVHVVSVMVPIFDSPKQPDWQYYLDPAHKAERWAELVEKYRQCWRLIFLCAHDKKLTKILLTDLGAGSWAQGLESESGGGAYSYAKLKSQSLEPVLAEFKDLFDILTLDCPLDEYLKELSEAELNETLIVNSWNPWTLVGHGHSPEDGVGGVLGRISPIALLCWPRTNPSIATVTVKHPMQRVPTDTSLY